MSSPVCSRTLYSSVAVDYHVGERDKQETRASSLRILFATLDILDFTNHLEILLKGGF